MHLVTFLNTIQQVKLLHSALVNQYQSQGSEHISHGDILLHGVNKLYDKAHTRAKALAPSWVNASLHLTPCKWPWLDRSHANKTTSLFILIKFPGITCIPQHSCWIPLPSWVVQTKIVLIVGFFFRVSRHASRS